jgi:FkbM family methyltransferase
MRGGTTEDQRMPSGKMRPVAAAVFKRFPLGRRFHELKLDRQRLLAEMPEIERERDEAVRKCHDLEVERERLLAAKFGIENERDQAIRTKEQADERTAHPEHLRPAELPIAIYRHLSSGNARPYESVPLASLALRKLGEDFVFDFETVIKYAIDNCWNEEDPRQAFGMPPEPYGLDHKKKYSAHALIERAREVIAPGLPGWQRLYKEISDDQSKALILTVVAYRAIGWRYVKLPLDNPKFRACLGAIGYLFNNAAPVPLHGLSLQRVDLSRLGFNVKLLSDPFGVFNEFLYPQYVYRGNQEDYGPRKGDTAIDCGACFGGTSLFFASCVGPKGTVYSFEFMDDNVEVFSRNMVLNPALSNRINLIEAPVWSKSGDAVYVTGRGPAAQVTSQEIAGAKKVSSVSIDDLVRTHSIKRVDFIKMDIEGAEHAALSGAIETIKRFKPRLAICVYHQLIDFFELPLLVKDWNPEYKIYFQHSSVHGDETVFFAI